MKSTLALSIAALALSGCTSLMAPPGALTTGPVTLEVQPQFRPGAFQTQTVLTPYASSSVDHVVVALYQRGDTGTETAVTSGGSPVEKEVASDSFSVPLRFVNLHHNTRYRIRAWAYKAPGRGAADLISVDAASYADVDVGMDDRPAVTTLPIQLANQTFSGRATGSLDFSSGTIVDAGSESIE